MDRARPSHPPGTAPGRQKVSARTRWLRLEPANRREAPTWPHPLQEHRWGPLPAPAILLRREPAKAGRGTVPQTATGIRPAALLAATRPASGGDGVVGLGRESDFPGVLPSWKARTTTKQMVESSNESIGVPGGSPEIKKSEHTRPKPNGRRSRQCKWRTGSDRPNFKPCPAGGWWRRPTNRGADIWLRQRGVFAAWWQQPPGEFHWQPQHDCRRQRIRLRGNRGIGKLFQLQTTWLGSTQSFVAVIAALLSGPCRNQGRRMAFIRRAQHANTQRQ